MFLPISPVRDPVVVSPAPSYSEPLRQGRGGRGNHGRRRRVRVGKARVKSVRCVERK